MLAILEMFETRRYPWNFPRFTTEINSNFECSTITFIPQYLIKWDETYKTPLVNSYSSNEKRVDSVFLTVLLFSFPELSKNGWPKNKKEQGSTFRPCNKTANLSLQPCYQAKFCRSSHWVISSRCKESSLSLWSSRSLRPLSRSLLSPQE